MQDEFLVDVALGDVWLEVGGFEDAQEQLVDELQVRPGGFQGRLVFLWVEFGAVGVRRGRECAEEVDGELEKRTIIVYLISSICLLQLFKKRSPKFLP